MWRPSFESKWRAITAATAASAVFVSATVWACGPFFATRALASRDAIALSAPPPGYARAVEGLAPPLKAPFQAVVSMDNPLEQTRIAEEADLRAALSGAGRAPAAAEDLVRRHAATRAAIASGGLAKAPPDPAAKAVPAGLPAEFEEYLTGAIAYHEKRFADARRAFQALLARPKAERAYRSTWAAFMIGKSHLAEGDFAKAAPWFDKTRALAREGLADRLGLAAASLGWQAQAELKQGHYDAAADLYFAQQAAGDSTAAMSLYEVAREVLAKGPPAAKRAAAGKSARRALIAYLVSDGEAKLRDAASAEAKLMEALLSETEGAKDVEGADRLAWAAYQAGAFQNAERWVARAPAGSPIADWIRAKLLLRAGKIDDAAAALARAVRALPPCAATTPGCDGEVDGFGRPRVAAELAALRMARSHYVEALDLLFKSGLWIDAAYVAERILTTDELRRYVDQHAPAAPRGKAGRAPELTTALRALLARRLARVGRRAQAEPYYPEDLRPRFQAYRDALRRAEDTRRSDAQRADAWWEAAKIARREGMELLGTEVEPDWQVSGGSFDEPPTAPPGGKTRIPVQKSERARFAQSRPDPDKRFHYRHVAAEHASQAARLLPEGSQQLVEVLCGAHGWLKNRDPRAAARFYKELVKRGKRSTCPG